MVGAAVVVNLGCLPVLLDPANSTGKNVGSTDGTSVAAVPCAFATERHTAMQVLVGAMVLWGIAEGYTPVLVRHCAAVSSACRSRQAVWSFGASSGPVLTTCAPLPCRTPSLLTVYQQVLSNTIKARRGHLLTRFLDLHVRSRTTTECARFCTQVAGRAYTHWRSAPMSASRAQARAGIPSTQ